MCGERVRQLGRRLRVWDNINIVNIKHVTISEISNRTVLGILQSLLGTPRFLFQKRFLLTNTRTPLED